IPAASRISSRNHLQGSAGALRHGRSLAADRPGQGHGRRTARLQISPLRIGSLPGIAAESAWDILNSDMNTLVQIQTGEPSAQVAADKEQILFAKLAGLPSLIVALSGGIDSVYLAWAAHQALGERALSVTAISASYSAFDREQVESFLRVSGARHEFIETHELENPAYRVNDTDRCYY